MRKNSAKGIIAKCFCYRCLGAVGQLPNCLNSSQLACETLSSSTFYVEVIVSVRTNKIVLCYPDSGNEFPQAIVWHLHYRYTLNYKLVIPFSIFFSVQFPILNFPNIVYVEHRASLNTLALAKVSVALL